jgi:hypothetical protein
MAISSHVVEEGPGKGKGHLEHGNGKGLGHLKHGDDAMDDGVIRSMSRALTTSITRLWTW